MSLWLQQFPQADGLSWKSPGPGTHEKYLEHIAARKNLRFVLGHFGQTVEGNISTSLEHITCIMTQNKKNRQQTFTSLDIGKMSNIINILPTFIISFHNLSNIFLLFFGPTVGPKQHGPDFPRRRCRRSPRCSSGCIPTPRSTFAPRCFLGPSRWSPLVENGRPVGGWTCWNKTQDFKSCGTKTLDMAIYIKNKHVNFVGFWEMFRGARASLSYFSRCSRSRLQGRRVLHLFLDHMCFQDGKRWIITEQPYFFWGVKSMNIS